MRTKQRVHWSPKLGNSNVQPAAGSGIALSKVSRALSSRVHSVSPFVFGADLKGKTCLIEIGSSAVSAERRVRFVFLTCLTVIPALPFCRATLVSERKPAGYPIALNHLGDHLRTRRLDLGLDSKQAAKLLGAHPQSIANWEEGRTAPAVSDIPRVLQFIGYDPRPVPADLIHRLKTHRSGRGSQREMAKRLGVDPGGFWKWETGRRKPTGDYLKKVELVLREER